MNNTRRTSLSLTKPARRKLEAMAAANEVSQSKLLSDLILGTKAPSMDNALDWLALLQGVFLEGARRGWIQQDEKQLTIELFTRATKRAMSTVKTGVEALQN